MERIKSTQGLVGFHRSYEFVLILRIGLESCLNITSSVTRGRRVFLEFWGRGGDYPANSVEIEKAMTHLGTF